ncbi:MAG: B12-binding domain-containing radical SAM protein [Clostridiales bacterium]
MSKVLLINPPAPFLAYPNAAPHLGIGYLLSFLRENHIETDYLNLECAEPSGIELPEGYDYYGISSVSGQYYYAKRLLSQIRNRKLGRTIIGGAHPSTMAEECLNDGFDYVVKGYGEIAMLKIINGKVAEGIIQGEFIENLDSLPFPAWEDLLQSNYEVSYGENVAHMFSMRGCPYSCSYCSSGEIFGRRVGFRSISNVIDEVKFLKEKYNIQRLYFFDPTFTIDRNRAIELARALKEYDVNWTCETRVDRIDPQILEIFHDSGCNLISYGIETGSEDVYNHLGKQASMGLNRKAINYSHDAGIKVKAFLMGALPDDNWNTLDSFKNFISANKPDNWLFSTFIPFPGTEQWNEPEKFGIKILCKDFRAYFNLGLNGRAPLNISNKYLSRAELKALRDDMLQFLLREVPNPRVEKAIALFDKQKKRLLPYIEDMNQEFLF